ncbi:MAG: hypothetical protein NVS9B10_04700 [Nevskia sp.]
MNRTRKQASRGIGLRWFDGLQFKLGLTFLLLLILLGGGSFYASDRLVGAGLDDASFRYETEVSRRLAAELGAMIGEAQTLADTLVLVMRDGRIPRAAQKAAIEAAAAKLAADSAVVSFGVWPEPVSTAPGVARDSLAWVRDASGKLGARADYNDPDIIPYWRERWYTPARLITGAQCYWTTRYLDLLTRRDVVTCVQPMLGARGFEGAVTVSMDLDALAARFAARTAGDSGYALLVERDGALLAMSKRARDRLGAAGPVRSLAELAQKQAEFNPLAVEAHARNETFFADALRSALYDARQVSQLKDNTRELSRNEAEAILGTLWNHAAGRAPAPPRMLSQPHDPVLGETGYAVLAALPGTDWQLASVTATREGQASARHLITLTLVITLGAVALTLLLAFVVLRGAILRPLRRMLDQLAGAQDAHSSDPVTLNQSARNELGALAHWFNERGGQVRELGERAQSTGSQLAIETAERQRMQETLTRVQESRHLVLTTIDDGVVTTDERGFVEDMNPVAEQLLGVNLRRVHGTPFAQSFQARLGGESGEVLPNPAEAALARGSRIEYPDGIFLTGNGIAEREIFLAVAPLRSRNGRAMGCVVVLRSLSALRSGNGTGSAEAHHPVTGLGGRNACERRVRGLLESARIGAGPHALLVIEIRPQGAGGTSRIDDAARARLAETIAAWAGSSEQVFDLAGERFAITLEQADGAQALERAQELLARVATMREQSGGDGITLAGALGIAPIDRLVDNAMEAIRRAGVACDKALSEGGSSALLYLPEHDRAGAANDDPLWVQRIRHGLDHNQFHVTTQWLAPSRAFAAEGQVFEVLVTLEDEEGFWASPEQFLPVAERHHLAGEIDRWVIARIIETLAANEGLCARLAFCSINLSAASITDPGFLDFMAEQLNGHPQVPVAKLCFALGEDIVSANTASAQRFCEALQAIGCRIAVEQRGMRQGLGIDSLRRLPVDLLKLSAQRFAAIADDAVEQTVAESLLKLSQLLNRRVVITQVDSEGLATIWRRLGADYLQGYAIAKASPVPFTGI